jgi:hypothetical protein
MRRLKAAMQQHGLKHDRVVTGNSAQLLRVPNTFNHKTNPPRPVGLIISDV